MLTNQNSTEEIEKIKVIAELNFMFYRDLVYLYGGVPLNYRICDQPVLNRVHRERP
jgi:hypothetical protein